MLAFALHAALGALVYVAAFVLRFDGALPPVVRPVLLQTLPFAIGIRVACYGAFRLHRGLWRFASVHDLLRLLQASTLAALLLGIVVFLLTGFEGFPRSVIVLDWLLGILVFGGKRFALRLWRETRQQPTFTASHGDRTRTLIVGAGEAGVIALRELSNGNGRNHAVVGFVDDAPEKQKMIIHGVPVMGMLRDVPDIVTAHGIAEVVVAMPSAPRKTVRAFVERHLPAGVGFRILPALPDTMTGRLEAQPLREVSLDDLLGRPPIRLDVKPVRDQIHGHRVIVTGAAGSIGSEIARQIAGLRPEHLVLVDMAESPLFDLDHALAKLAPDVPRTAVIADIRSETQMRRVFESHRPHYAYYAAVYKHVPLMQDFPLQAVENNVIGTQNVARAAREVGVLKFVLISTDKAVNPANVMGATKRLAEMVVSGLNGNGTEFLAVRFGNVLGSNGSVVPIFRRQIAEGGPVTVTDARMTRFFMTIPEAVELVLQAGAHGRGGDVFLLDMGEPVRIIDMARDLIKLSGLSPGHDIEIVCTGIRPGEKITEELSAYREVSTPTGIPRLNRLDNHKAAFETADIVATVTTLGDAVARGAEADALRALWKAVAPEQATAPDEPRRKSHVGLQEVLSRKIHSHILIPGTLASA